jgi:hypothetical protein
MTTVKTGKQTKPEGDREKNGKKRVFTNTLYKPMPTHFLTCHSKTLHLGHKGWRVSPSGKTCLWKEED